MERIVIAMADIVQGDEHILQHRIHSARAGAYGLTGFFGGGLEFGETYKRTTAREVGEETSLEVDEADLQEVGLFSADMEHNGKALKIVGKCFRIEVPPGVEILAKEGAIVRIPKGELYKHIQEYSPATAEVVKQYYQEGTE